MLSFLVLAAAAGVPAAQGPAEGKAVPVHAQAAWTFAPAGPDDARGRPALHVIRSQGDLIKASGLAGDGRTRIQLAQFLAKSLKVDEMDYEKKMLVVITAGVKGSGGYKVEAAGAERKGDTLTVRWKLHAPKGAATDALTHPAVIVLLDRFDGTVRVDPPLPAKRE